MRHAVSRLRPDWLDTEGHVCSSSGLGAEGPAVFRWHGKHYLFASHLTGWEPNVPILHESTAGGMCSTFWRLLPQPTDGPGADTTYNSQSTFIFEHRFADGTPLLLWMGDRWNSQGPGGVGNASYVWLPLLPRIGVPGFELVWAEGWSVQAFKGATWDASAQQVRFLPGAAGAGSSTAAAAVS
ncbi:hypothetical protein COHA_005620 [Chlorella ohadii]|uniref:Uncharacterized protein n=1 Tax=Chlorella ohadii TaxID=2649997 RepID=A0AAD5DQR7_9CHLO|nr:hypothetical protein COHA_005620 [Chlorella ohadii]